MNLQDVPIPVLVENMIHPDRQKMVGQKFKAVHLRSTKGQTLNGKVCVVRGFDSQTTEARLHCYFEDTNETIKLKHSNLISLEANNETLENYMENSSPVPNDMLAACLEHAIQKHGSGTDREDLMHRISLYKGLLEKLRDPQSDLTADDFCFPCGAGSELLTDGFGVVMNQMKPTCYGNETQDMRYIDIGLKGDGHTECAVCHEVLTEDHTTVLVTLPCLHIFHEHCIVQWLGSDLGRRSWTCPFCRALVPHDMSTYRVQYDEQLQRRVDEYPLSGFCTKCMIMIMERSRNAPLGYEDEEGTVQVGPIGVRRPVA